MIRSIQRLLLLLTLTVPQLCASLGYVHFGDGISLVTVDNLYLTMTPGAANAGTTSGIQDQNNNNVFQLFDAHSNNSGATANYGQTVGLQLTANNVWVTLDPATIETPGYVRNNAPQQLSWEQLQLISVTSSSGPINYNDQVYLGHTYNGTDYVYVMINDTIATTTNTIGGATPFTITPASFTGYSQVTPNSPNPLRDWGLCTMDYNNNSNSYHFNMNANQENGGTLSQDSQTKYIVIQAAGQQGSNPILYGAPIYISNNDSIYYVTMNLPYPYHSTSHVRNDFPTTSQPSVWETMYFIPAPSTNTAGTSRNGDIIYSGDKAYLARNGLIEGTFQTEYVTIDGSGNVSTTFNFADAAELIINVV